MGTYLPIKELVLPAEHKCVECYRISKCMLSFDTCVLCEGPFESLKHHADCCRLTVLENEQKRVVKLGKGPGDGYAYFMSLVYKKWDREVQE